MYGLAQINPYLLSAERPLKVFMVCEECFDFVGVIFGDDEIFVENGFICLQPLAKIFPRFVELRI